jgi:glycosyltransferase involved in cell wall biosynthesis
MPEVSVVVPAYNAARFVASAIESVLAQTYDDYEILVVDDGSTDDTREVVNQYKSAKIRYIAQKNAGVAVARNTGMAEGRGRWVAFLDADDTWFPTKLERQMHALRADSSARVCYSAFTVVDASLAPIGVRRSARVGTALEDLLLRGNIVGSICTVLCDREMILSTGGFDPRLSQCADWEMWVRLAARTEFVYVDESLVTYRQHDSNMSRNAGLLETDSLLVLESGFGLPALPEPIRKRRREAYARNYTVLAGTYFQARRYLDFLRTAAQAVLRQPSQARYFMQYPLRVLKRASARA